jgi:lysyl-tRNA synthetase class 1
MSPSSIISSEEIQNALYKIGRENGYADNLRGFFSELYQILLGQTQGPRLGSFIQLFGIEKTIELVRNKIDTGL